MGDLDFTKYKTHQEAAQAIADSLNTYKENRPGAIKASFSSFLKRELLKGLAIQKELQASGAKEIPEDKQNVLTVHMLYHFPGMSDSADLPSPSSSDYMIYFAFLMV